MELDEAQRRAVAVVVEIAMDPKVAPKWRAKAAAILARACLSGCKPALEWLNKRTDC